jgi:two-component system response regulator PilR (NtrC family)
MSSVAPPAPSPSKLDLFGRTVLFIEDHKDSRDLLTSVLRWLRAHVVAVANIEEAEREMQFARPHLIVCDMKLPDGTGLDFIKWVRSQRRDGKTPCIAITGWENHFPANAAKGFDAYMRKPIDLDKFCTLAVSLAQR